MRREWPWFESRMTYANAVLPHALFVAAQHWPQEPFLHVAETSFGFLDLVTTSAGVFWPVGNRDWYPHGEDKALYDQQPVEASTMADAALAAYGASANESYVTIFHRAQGWFHGQNSLRQPLADVGCGACCDGLEVGGMNRNQGAESTLAYLWTELHNIEIQHVLGDERKPAAAGI